MSVLILNEQEVRQCLSLDNTALAVIEEAFTWTATGRIAMPPVMHIDVEDGGDVDIKSAYVAGLDAFAIKIASGFYNNPEHGLPSSSSTIVVMSAVTGFCEAVLLDNGYLMNLRTGLAGAVAASHLAPDSVDTVGVIGTGIQARYQVECLKLVRDFKRVLVSGRDAEKASAYATEMQARLGMTVQYTTSVAELVGESQVVVTTTASTEPLIKSEWLHPGLHLTAVGSDLPGKQELEADVLSKADLVVCDSIAQCKIGGELQYASVPGGITEQAAVIELGGITSGKLSGRKDRNDITVCDLTGMGVQDTAIALAVLARAKESGIGLQIAN